MPSNLIRRLLPYFYLAAFAFLLTTFLLRHLTNWNFPLSGEFLTSPFFSEILNLSLGVWDKHFGLGFSNLLGSAGMAQYAADYSGAMWIVPDSLSTFFQMMGGGYFFNYGFNFLVLGIGVYIAITYIWTEIGSHSLANRLILCSALIIIFSSTDFFINKVGSAGRFPAGQGLLLLAFIYYRKLCKYKQDRIGSPDFVSFFLILATLLLIFNPYFLAFGLFIGIQAFIEFFCASEKKMSITIFYAKIFAISCALIFIMCGYLFIPVLLSTGSNFMSGAVGRHDSPMQYPLLELIRFFNNPKQTLVSILGAWLQVGLAILGIVFALLTPTIRKWVRPDFVCIVVFAFLAKGSAAPLPEINQWLHVNIPLIRLMGSSYPYFGMLYTLLIYYSIYGLARTINFSRNYFLRSGAWISWAFIIFIVLVAIFRNDDYLSGDFGGRVQSIEYPTEYYQFKVNAEQKMQNGRAYYFPDYAARIGVDYIYSPQHSIRQMDCCYEMPFSSTFPINIEWSNFNKYSGYYGQTMNFLINYLQIADELAAVLSKSGTRYVVFDLSLKKEANASYRMMAVRDQVKTSNLFTYVPTLSNAYIEVYENKQWKVASDAVKHLTLSSDDPNVFLNAIRTPLRVSNDPIVVSGAISLQYATKLKNEKILNRIELYNSNKIQMMLDLMRSDYELRPDAGTLSALGILGWYTNNQVYQSQVTGKYGGRFIGRFPVATTAAASRTSYYSAITPNQEYRLFIRAMVSPDSGRVLVHINNEIRLLDLRSKGYVGLQWFDLGEVSVNADSVKIQIESIDPGYYKRIDVISLVPKNIVSISTALINNLFSDVKIVKINKPDYLEWKELNQSIRVNDTHDQIFGKKIEVAPKKLMVNHKNFMLFEDFDRFDEAIAQESYNLTDIQKRGSLVSQQNSLDKRFMRIYSGENQRFIASAGIDSGSYYLDYEFNSCQIFSDLKLSLGTIFASAERPIKILVSEDGSSWLEANSLISDEKRVIDLGDFARGKKRVLLKIAHHKKNKTQPSIVLTDLKIFGQAGQDSMNCQYIPTKEVGSSPASFNSEGIIKLEATSIVALINRAYDKNWRLGSTSAINVDYGFAAFPLIDNHFKSKLINLWENKYPLLIFFSFSAYLLLWLLFLWDLFIRKKR